MEDTNECGELPHIVYTGLYIVLMLIRSLNCLHRHPRGSLKSDNTSTQRLDCVCLHFRENNDDVKEKKKDVLQSLVHIRKP